MDVTAMNLKICMVSSLMNPVQFINADLVSGIMPIFIHIGKVDSQNGLRNLTKTFIRFSFHHVPPA